METTVIHSGEISAAFRAAMRRIASTVTIVTAADAFRHHGMTMTAVSSLSMEPPSMLVCVNQNTLLHDIMLSARRFCVNVLRHDHAALSTAFSGAVPAAERFTDAWRVGADCPPYLPDAQAVIVCRKTAAVPYGSHTIFIGAAENVILNDDARPLLYRNASYC